MRIDRTALAEKLRTLIKSSTAEAIGQEVGDLRHDLAVLKEEVDRLREAQSGVASLTESVHQIVAAGFDEIPRLAEELDRIRRSDEYQSAFHATEPLVSVRIATYNNPEMLIDRAISSVLAQTYERFEVIVVGDGCTDDTEEQVAALRDPRIRFVNLVSRAAYPDDSRKRWLVAGSPAMNLGAHLARGLWIAPLDHDDEFLPEHIETLLGAAQARELEMVYGRLLAVTPPGFDDWTIGTSPPRLGEFGFQAAIHLGALRTFDYNPKSWALDEPGDWNLCRRMLEAGVRIGWVDEVVTKYYPGPFVLAHRSEVGR